MPNYLSRCLSRAASIPRWFDWVLMLQSCGRRMREGVQ